ncbi:MAG: hypothetical protein N4A38_00315 [Candidatus Gracilibacteria bacterium]|nr:hypothetical protein [Candidatus Gracilibacteria bacterium]
MKKKIIYILLISIFSINFVYAENIFDKIFEKSENIDIDFSSDIKTENIDNTEEIDKKKTYKTKEERNFVAYEDPDDFKEQYNTPIAKDFKKNIDKKVLPEWVKETKSSKAGQELFITCKMLNGDFKAINILNKNGYIIPEFYKNDRGNYYTYINGTKNIYVGDGVYERVKECDFSILD